MGYLRRKTEADGEPRLLHTVRGVGYVLQRGRCATLRRRHVAPSPAALAGPARWRSLAPRARRRSWWCAASCAARSTTRCAGGRPRGEDVPFARRRRRPPAPSAPTDAARRASRDPADRASRRPTAARRARRATSSSWLGAASVLAPGAAAQPQLPADERHAQPVARAARAPFFTDATVDGVHVRVSRARSSRGVAVQVAAPRRRGDDALRRLRWILAAVGVGGVGAGRRPRPGGHAHGARAGARAERGGRARRRDARPEPAHRGRAAATS